MIKDLSVALRALPTPEAEPRLRARILAARAGGKRVRLPESGRTVRTRFLVAAAVVALVAIANWTRLGPGRAQDGGRHSYDLLGGAPWWPTVMAAQEARIAPARPKYGPIVDFDPSRVSGGTWTYEGRTTTDNIYTGIYGRRAITASATTLDGTAVWLVTTKRSPMPGAADSLYVSRATLRPVRYALNSRSSHIYVEQRYSRDSVHETIDVTGHNKERHLRGAAALPTTGEVFVLMGPFATDLNLLAQALPLQRGWRGSAYSLGLVSYYRGSRPLTPVDFRVVGRARVTVPAGSFDCWKIEVVQRDASGDFRWLVWLSQDQQWVVKIEQRGGDFVTEQVLTSYQSPTSPAP